VIKYGTYYIFVKNVHLITGWNCSKIYRYIKIFDCKYLMI